MISACISLVLEEYENVLDEHLDVIISGTAVSSNYCCKFFGSNLQYCVFCVMSWKHWTLKNLRLSLAVVFFSEKQILSLS